MIYSQSTGKLTNNNGVILGIGYSGNGKGKNNPDMQNIKNVGPIPVGIYDIGKPYDSLHTGKFTLPLTPNKDNIMFNRDQFKIHGDNISNPGTASSGCIILSYTIRFKINESLDKILNVIK